MLAVANYTVFWTVDEAC